MPVHTSSKLGFIITHLLVSTSLAQLISGSNGKIRPGITSNEPHDTSVEQLFGKPGKIRPGITSNEPHDTSIEFEEEFNVELASISGKTI